MNAMKAQEISDKLYSEFGLHDHNRRTPSLIIWALKAAATEGAIAELEDMIEKTKNENTKQINYESIHIL